MLKLQTKLIIASTVVLLSWAIFDTQTACAFQDDAKPATDAKPVTDAKPATDAKPVTDTQSKKEPGDQSTAESEIITKRTGATLWKEHVEPLLKQNCFKCHGSAKKANDLDLRTLDSMVKGGERGSSVVAGKPNESLIYLYLQTGVEPHMPPGKQLSKEEIDLVKQWIKRIGDPALAKENPANNSSQPNAGANAEPQSPLLPTGVDPTLVIDLLIQKGWQDQKVQPSAISSDSTFVRRIYLDLIGRIPTTKERHDFETSTNSQKRELLIEKLLSSPDFGSHMAQQFNAMLMGRKGKQKTNQRNSSGWIGYLKRSFKQNKPWNQITKEVLLARPTDPKDRGAVWYLYERNNNYQEIAEAISPAFFGVQIQCAQCHNHPIADEILQEHYWGLVAFFNRGKNVGDKKGLRIEESAIGGFSQFTNLEGKAYDNILSFLKKPPVPDVRPKGKQKEVDSDDLYIVKKNIKIPKFSRREKFVSEVVDENPLIARAFVNRMWALLVGRGFVHPFDKMNSAHPPSHPQLLDWLSADFEENNFDIKRLIRSITRSKVYQLDSVPASQNIPESAFAYGLQKPLSAESVYRSMIVALNDDPQSLTEPIKSPMLDQLRSNFKEIIFVDKISTLQQTLFLSNNQLMQELVKPVAPNLTSFIASDPNRQSINKAFERIFGRAPLSDEADASLKFLGRPNSSPQVNAQNLIWAMLNSSEFWINH